MTAGAWVALGLRLTFLMAGAVCAVVGLVTALRGIVNEFRDQRIPEEHADHALAEVAQRELDELCARAGVDPIALFVVPVLGRPIPDHARGLGIGGLALTRFRPRQRPIVLVAAAATTLSSAARRDLLAHELAHVVRRSTAWSSLLPYVPPASTLLVIAAAVGLGLCIDTGIGAAVFIVVTLMLVPVWMYLSRREEHAADLYAYDLTGDLAGARELMSVYPQPGGSALVRALRRVFASHPDPVSRVGAVERHARRDQQ